MGEDEASRAESRLKTNKVKANMKGIALTFKDQQRKMTSLTSRRLPTRVSHLLLASLLSYLVLLVQAVLSSGPTFPGVARDLASFCSARPSLSIDLAPMLVHVKRNTSFNYKLYLFSSDEHVFQTGQIVPRDDFRIHSFPVKLKHLSEFVPVDGLQSAGEQGATSSPVEVYQMLAKNQSQEFRRVPSDSFDPKRFFARVPLLPEETSQARKKLRSAHSTSSTTTAHTPTVDLFDALPGDEAFTSDSAARFKPEVGRSELRDINANIQFDRDDQLAILSHSGAKLRELSRRQAETSGASQTKQAQPANHHQTLVMPVGSFSSFHVNLTYLARKDFDQREPELVRFRVDPQRFQVSRVDLLTAHAARVTGAESETKAAVQDERANLDDYAFLSHKLLRDPSTRLTSISQIYEDWITRNFYTIVYIQRRLNADDEEGDDVKRAADEIESEDATRRPGSAGSGKARGEIVTERLVFRGSSVVLLGADQLDYHVKASAFITEKNGLHYYLEFLPNGKFYLGAVDWTKRPFKFVDSHRFPIKPTQTLFDNEELLLCPPSVCYSDRPIDELVAYGRIALTDRLQREAAILARSSWSAAHSAMSASGAALLKPISHERLHEVLPSRAQDQRNKERGESATTISHQSEPISLDNLIEAMRSDSGRLNVRLHLRDWVWQMERSRDIATPSSPPGGNQHHSNASRFAWQYERARRNEIKVAPDTYGFALVGHEIDASYRVFNELYLIAANQLISINYTLVNETVTSMQPVDEEFAGLSSNLLDPITGAFYDRYSNQIFFFKGDRYVGYDYATKKPLEDFLLAPAIDSSLGGLSLALMMQQASPTSGSARGSELQQRPLVSSLPVVGILGRQLYVDAIYHDLSEDLVYVFSGMKFYTLPANSFKDGAFRFDAAKSRGPNMQCINEHLLAGCRFDAAYPNPCTDKIEPSGSHSDLAHGNDEPANHSHDEWSHYKHAVRLPVNKTAIGTPHKSSENKPARVSKFSEEQQMKLRSIAARGGLQDFLLENTLFAQGAKAFEPLIDPENSFMEAPRAREREQIVVYLLIAMVFITILATVAMICVVLNWTQQLKSNQDQKKAGRLSSLQQTSGQLLTERPAYPTAISKYLSNQYQPQQQHQQPTRPLSYYNPQTLATDRRQRSGRPAPLASPPPIPPPPESRRQYRTQALGDLTANKSGPQLQSSFVNSSVL